MSEALAAKTWIKHAGMIRALLVVGARPNFMKVAPICAAMSARRGAFEPVLVHTGQHYDESMSRVFFGDLGIREPDEFLGVGSGTHAAQTARIMTAFEPVIEKYAPEWVVVVGDVNSTLACALAAAKCGVKVGHVEAGLRSRDRTMPEEINRIVTDHVADLLLTPSRDADENLRAEGIPAARIRFVGNVMIDTLVKLLPKAVSGDTLRRLEVAPREFALVTLHRPSNVDDPAVLAEILSALRDAARRVQIVFPVHPRTRDRIAKLGLRANCDHIRMTGPLGYVDCLALMRSARFVLTDSGGMQEETTYLGVPCLTARPNTERPITVTAGTNRLVPSTRRAIIEAVDDVLERPPCHRGVPDLWDGCAAGRIVDAIEGAGH